VKLLALPIITPTSPQTGLRAALRKVATEYQEIDWYPFWPNRIRDLRRRVVQQARQFNPDAVWMQLQTDDVLTAAEFKAIPGFKIVWGGDIRDRVMRWAIDAAPHVDITLMSNWRDVDALREHGFKADYMQIGFSDSVFTGEGPKRDGTPEIVAMFNNYCSRFPRSVFRARLVMALQQRYGSRFAVYGNGWGENDKWLSEPEEAAAYRTCKIAISAEHFFVRGFFSDRAFRATGSGACLLADKFPGYEDYFKDGHEAIFWSDQNELFKLIDRLLENETERANIAGAGCRRAHSTHTWDCRIQDMMKFIPQAVA
jgi:hypothetical protein